MGGGGLQLLAVDDADDGFFDLGIDTGGSDVHSHALEKDGGAAIADHLLDHAVCFLDRTFLPLHALLYILEVTRYRVLDPERKKGLRFLLVHHLDHLDELELHFLRRGFLDHLLEVPHHGAEEMLGRDQHFTALQARVDPLPQLELELARQQFGGDRVCRGSRHDKAIESLRVARREIDGRRFIDCLRASKIYEYGPAADILLDSVL